MLRRAVPMLSLALLIAAQASVVGRLDWSRYTEHGVVTVTTTNSDGSPRDTKAWLAVVGGVTCEPEALAGAMASRRPL
jgi:hypothetical protein